MNLSIVIPNYNGVHYLEDCLPSLTTSIKRCPKSNFEIIIVDNGSTDSSAKIAKRYKANFIPLSKNYGFAAAVNKGIFKSRYEYVCVMNNDLLLSIDWMISMKKAIEKYPEYSVFCGTVLDKSGKTIESQGMDYFMSGKAENINNNKVYNPDSIKSAPSQVWGTSAAVVIYNKAHIMTVGLFDESFFAYIEDVDLSYRLYKSGRKTLLVPKSISYHLGGGTSSKMGNLRAKYTFVNWIRLIIKNYTLSELLLNLPGILTQRLRNLSYLIRSSNII